MLQETINQTEPKYPNSLPKELYPTPTFLSYHTDTCVKRFDYILYRFSPRIITKKLLVRQ